MIGRFFISFLCAFLCTLIATPLVARLAAKLKLMDVPDARKVHATPTPRIGGLAIAVSFFAIVLGLFLFDTEPNKLLVGDANNTLLPLLAGALGFLLVGFIDDAWQMRSQLKFLLLLGISAGVCYLGLRIDTISLGTKDLQFSLGAWSWPVTMLWIVGITVSINFADGLDGLAAGISTVAAFLIAVVAYIPTHNHGLIMIPALALAGSLLGFLVFNFYPAKIFMGDCGSMFIGFMLSTLAIRCAAPADKSTLPSESTLGILAVAMALGVPVLDTAVTFLRRAVLQRRSMFAAEKGHIHHHLLFLGLKQKHAVLLLYGVTLVSAGSGLMLLFGQWGIHMFVVGGVLALPLLLLFKLTGYVHFGKTLAAVRRNLSIGREEKNYRESFEQMQLRFNQVENFEAWWSEVCNAADMMDVVRIALPLPTRAGTNQVREWERSGFNGKDTLRLIVPIRQRRVGGPLRANVEVDATDSLEAAGRRLTFFARLLEEYSIANLPEAAKLARGGAKAHTGGTNGTNGHVADGESGNEAAETAIPVRRLPGVRVAVVHDFLYTYAGAERVLEQILNVFPNADLFSLFDFLPDGERDFIQNKKVQTSFIQGLPFAKKKHRTFLPLMPLAIEQLDVSKYDVVISSSYAVAKGVITRPDQMHICYCHSPIRYAWDLQHQYLREAGLKGIKSLLPRAILHYIRNWDARSANSVDVFLTNSEFVGRRIQKFYRRNSRAVYPPVDTHEFVLESQKEDFYVTASRFVPYKRIDLIVEAFSYLPDRRLIVIGEGPMFERVKAKAGPNVKLLGYQPTERLKSYMQRARAFVFAAEEDFGIVPVEAQACGTPVIAFARGGTAETVVDGKTGVFFEEQTVESLVRAIQRFEGMTWDAAAIREHSQKFSTERFREEFGDIVERAWASFSRGRHVTTDPLLRELEEDDTVERQRSRDALAVHADVRGMVASGMLSAAHPEEDVEIRRAAVPERVGD